MRLICFLVLLHHIQGLWLPFANFDYMLENLKRVAYREDADQDENDYIRQFAKAGLDVVTNLGKYLQVSLSAQDTRALANGIRRLFNVTTTTHPSPTHFNTKTSRFTFPYTTPLWWSTTQSSTTTRRPTTEAPLTTTTTRTTTTAIEEAKPRYTFKPVVPQTTTPYPVWPTTPRRATITWRPVFPVVIMPDSTEAPSIEEEETRSNVPDIVKAVFQARRGGKPEKELPTATTTSNNTSAEVCKPGSRCVLALRSFETADPVFQYAYSHSTMIDDAMQSLLKETQAATYPMPITWKDSVAPELLQLTQTLMTLYRPSRCLVVGVFTGLGLFGIAEHVDSRGIVVALEHPEYSQFWEKIGLKHAQKLSHTPASRVQMRSAEPIERALPRLATVEPNTFDFIFLDDFKRSNYLDDYEHSVRLMRSGGLLIINQALNGGGVLSGTEHMTKEDKVIRDMNSKIQRDSRVRASLLPYSGGTWVITKK